MGDLATLINEAGKKVVVKSGSQEATDYFGQGFQLMGESGAWTSPTTQATTVKKATLVNPKTGERRAVAVDSAESKQLMSEGYGLEGTTKGQLAVTPTDTARDRAAMTNEGWNYVGSLEQKDQMIRAGKEVTLESGNYYWKDKIQEGPTQTTPPTSDSSTARKETIKAPAPIVTPSPEKFNPTMFNVPGMPQFPSQPFPQAPDLVADYLNFRKT